MAVDNDRRRLVHAAAVIADMPLDGDLDRHGEAGGDGVRAPRIDDAPESLVGIGREPMETGIEIADGLAREVDGDHCLSHE